MLRQQRPDDLLPTWFALRKYQQPRARAWRVVDFTSLGVTRVSWEGKRARRLAVA
jgi:hypothetical protein